MWPSSCWREELTPTLVYACWTPLMAAAINRNMEVIECLLNHQPPVPIDGRNEEGATALWWACYEGRSKVARMLLEAGADHTIADKYGQTPMDIAREKGCQSCIELFQVIRAYRFLRRAFILMPVLLPKIPPYPLPSFPILYPFSLLLFQRSFSSSSFSFSPSMA